MDLAHSLSIFALLGPRETVALLRDRDRRLTVLAGDSCLPHSAGSAGRVAKGDLRALRLCHIISTLHVVLAWSNGSFDASLAFFADREALGIVAELVTPVFVLAGSNIDVATSAEGMGA
eukprot:CAMPEP_0185583546 /NCGR_PEP_ID=MMETSP0434-20130131/25057_1 /TAXON_ID=626734 ORGANISM="Favella taraikaensis, Strain Fe Narragansett Bay" /NCGR_SAMPLE_ID=MMETSP0434 /ASSEMBLY_ACC=CAM_ASM_000379 /LENGTH=118 /DNA_ID=CAMNT_0028202741 /DNA_START=1189 /DNA_END=1545 /DNA_ORIENTATION=-